MLCTPTRPKGCPARTRLSLLWSLVDQYGAKPFHTKVPADQNDARSLVVAGPVFKPVDLMDLLLDAMSNHGPFGIIGKFHKPLQSQQVTANAEFESLQKQIEPGGFQRLFD